MQEQITIYIDAVRRGWWVIAILTLATLSLALARAYTTDPTYRTQATFIVTPISSITDSDEVLRSLSTLDRDSIALTYAEILESRRVTDEAAASLGLANLRGYSFETIVLPDSNVLQLTITGPDPQHIADMANQMGFHAIHFIEERYPVYEMLYLDSATSPNNPISPNPERDAIFAILLGIVVSVAVLFVNIQLRTAGISLFPPHVPPAGPAS